MNFKAFKKQSSKPTWQQIRNALHTCKWLLLFLSISGTSCSGSKNSPAFLTKKSTTDHTLDNGFILSCSDYFKMLYGRFNNYSNSFYSESLELKPSDGLEKNLDQAKTIADTLNRDISNLSFLQAEPNCIDSATSLTIDPKNDLVLQRAANDIQWRRTSFERVIQYDRARKRFERSTGIRFIERAPSDKLDSLIDFSFFNESRQNPDLGEVLNGARAYRNDLDQLQDYFPTISDTCSNCDILEEIMRIEFLITALYELILKFPLGDNFYESLRSKIDAQTLPACSDTCLKNYELLTDPQKTGKYSFKKIPRLTEVAKAISELKLINDYYTNLVNRASDLRYSGECYDISRNRVINPHTDFTLNSNYKRLVIEKQRFELVTQYYWNKQRLIDSTGIYFRPSAYNDTVSFDDAFFKLRNLDPTIFEVIRGVNKYLEYLNQLQEPLLKLNPSLGVSLNTEINDVTLFVDRLSQLAETQGFKASFQKAFFSAPPRRNPFTFRSEQGYGAGAQGNTRNQVPKTPSFYQPTPSKRDELITEIKRLLKTSEFQGLLNKYNKKIEISESLSHEELLKICRLKILFVLHPDKAETHQKATRSEQFSKFNQLLNQFKLENNL